MSDVITCPECGATSPSGSTWCTLCFAKFDDGKAEADEPVVDLVPDAPSQGPPVGPSVDLGEPLAPGGPPAGPGEQLSLMEDDSPTWQCRFCDTKVAVEETECPMCHQTIYDSYGAREEQPEIDQGDALRWAFLPGFGHAKVGQGLLGAALGILVAVSLVFGIALLTSGSTGYGSVLVFLGLGMWMAGGYDVLQYARGETDQILLRPRVVSVLAAVVFMVIVGSAVSARSVIGR